LFHNPVQDKLGRWIPLTVGNERSVSGRDLI
jgi:hypothetical protein